MTTTTQTNAAESVKLGDAEKTRISLAVSSFINAEKAADDAAQADQKFSVKMAEVFAPDMTFEQYKLARDAWKAGYANAKGLTNPNSIDSAFSRALDRMNSYLRRTDCETFNIPSATSKQAVSNKKAVEATKKVIDALVKKPEVEIAKVIEEAAKAGNKNDLRAATMALAQKAEAVKKAEAAKVAKLYDAAIKALKDHKADEAYLKAVLAIKV